MALVSRDVRAATLDFTGRAYNLDRRLARFFGDPAAFRALMARTRVVISGSFALQFLDRSFYPESDLDLYVSTEGSFREIGLWLMQDEGYVFKPSAVQAASFWEEAEELDEEEWEDYGHMRVTAVYTFERRVSRDSNLDSDMDPDTANIRKVQVIVPLITEFEQTKYSPFDVILHFHSSTCLVVFMMRAQDH